MALVTHETVVSSPQAGRVDRIVQALTGLSRARVRGLFDHRCVTVNGELCLEPGTTVHVGQRVAVRYDPCRRYQALPRPRAAGKFRLVYEDDAIIVVDKAPGVLTVPTAHHEQDTLVHEIARHLSGSPRIRKRAYIVHRLDRDTSGLLVFAKSEAIAQRLKAQFERHKPEREYIALVVGPLPRREDTIRSYLATASDLDQYSTHDARAGKLAVTHYRVEARWPGVDKVRVRLETGRRNQIRVHLAELGHSILGDSRYGRNEGVRLGWYERRLALHAAVLGFEHPVSGKSLRFTSPEPAAFGRFLARLSAKRAGRDASARHTRQ